MKAAAWVRYTVGALPHFVPVINERVTFECSAIDAFEYEPLYTADQLRQAKVEILRRAREVCFLGGDQYGYDTLGRMADELENGE